MTYRDFLNCYLKYEKNVPLETKLCSYLGIREDSEEMQKLTWSGIFESRKIGLANATSAQILQHLLEHKWILEPDDKDMIVMQHIFRYEFDDLQKQMTSSLVVRGKDKVHTAMAITVGYPVAIAAKLLLTGKIQAKGVQVPLSREIYEPVLAELKEYGVRFIEEETVIND